MKYTEANIASLGPLWHPRVNSHSHRNEYSPRPLLRKPFLQILRLLHVTKNCDVMSLWTLSTVRRVKY
jgi:hypothetical protein